MGNIEVARLKYTGISFSIKDANKTLIIGGCFARKYFLSLYT